MIAETVMKFIATAEVGENEDKPYVPGSGFSEELQEISCNCRKCKSTGTTGIPDGLDTSSAMKCLLSFVDDLSDVLPEKLLKEPTIKNLRSFFSGQGFFLGIKLTMDCHSHLGKLIIIAHHPCLSITLSHRLGYSALPQPRSKPKFVTLSATMLQEILAASIAKKAQEENTRRMTEAMMEAGKKKGKKKGKPKSQINDLTQQYQHQLFEYIVKDKALAQKWLQCHNWDHGCTTENGESSIFLYIF
jgi:hypothetical protein